MVLDSSSASASFARLLTHNADWVGYDQLPELKTLSKQLKQDPSLVVAADIE